MDDLQRQMDDITEFIDSLKIEKAKNRQSHAKLLAALAELVIDDDD